MFALRRRGTVIDEGLKIVGSVTAEGLVEVNGHIEGDQRVIVNGSVAGPIQGGDVILKSQAHVVGDIQHKSLSIETGAYFVGRSMQAGSSNGHHPKSVDVAPPREWATNARGIVAAAE